MCATESNGTSGTTFPFVASVCPVKTRRKMEVLNHTVLEERRQVPNGGRARKKKSPGMRSSNQRSGPECESSLAGLIRDVSTQFHGADERRSTRNSSATLEPGSRSGLPGDVLGHVEVAGGNSETARHLHLLSLARTGDSIVFMRSCPSAFGKSITEAFRMLRLDGNLRRPFLSFRGNDRVP